MVPLPLANLADGPLPGTPGSSLTEADWAAITAAMRASLAPSPNPVEGANQQALWQFGCLATGPGATACVVLVLAGVLFTQQGGLIAIVQPLSGGWEQPALDTAIDLSELRGPAQVDRATLEQKAEQDELALHWVVPELAREKLQRTRFSALHTLFDDFEYQCEHWTRRHSSTSVRIYGYWMR